MTVVSLKKVSRKTNNNNKPKTKTVTTINTVISKQTELLILEHTLCRVYFLSPDTYDLYNIDRVREIINVISHLNIRIMAYYYRTKSKTIRTYII